MNHESAGAPKPPPDTTSHGTTLDESYALAGYKVKVLAGGHFGDYTTTASEWRVMGGLLVFNDGQHDLLVVHVAQVVSVVAILADMNAKEPTDHPGVPHPPGECDYCDRLRGE